MEEKYSKQNKNRKCFKHMFCGKRKPHKESDKDPVENQRKRL